MIERRTQKKNYEFLVTLEGNCYVAEASKKINLQLKTSSLFVLRLRNGWLRARRDLLLNES